MERRLTSVRREPYAARDERDARKRVAGSPLPAKRCGRTAPGHAPFGARRIPLSVSRHSIAQICGCPGAARPGRRGCSAFGLSMRVSTSPGPCEVSGTVRRCLADGGRPSTVGACRGATSRSGSAGASQGLDPDAAVRLKVRGPLTPGSVRTLTAAQVRALARATMNVTLPRGSRRVDRMDGPGF